MQLVGLPVMVGVSRHLLGMSCIPQKDRNVNHSLGKVVEGKLMGRSNCGQMREIDLVACL